MKISKIKKIIPVAMKQVSFVSKELGHWYQDGAMYAKHIIALGLQAIFRCSDNELPDELESRNLLDALGISTKK
ncbi:MAG: hypothetical protein M1448_03885 [Candidatus Marsarchaeota archaeon]|nr:hypothetical protein [Candidatus Marsarchaeota archaeon]